MSLLTYIAKRILLAVPVILTAIVINFLIIHSVPGDPIVMLVAGYETDPEYVALMRKEFGLDRPIHERLLVYIIQVLQGNLGRSTFGKPVLELVWERVPLTLLLMGMALAIAVTLGILLGTLSSSRVNSIADSVITSLSVTGYSVPVFWLAQILVVVFAVQLGWLPGFGYSSLKADLTGLAHLIDVLRHALLPATALALNQLALVVRLTRSSMLNVLTENYIITARSKGLADRSVIFGHALKNASLPIVTFTGVQLGYLLTGAVLTETVFAWPGLGRLLYDALLWRDYPILLSMFLFAAIIVTVANLVTDILYAVLDPRIRYAE